MNNQVKKPFDFQKLNLNASQRQLLLKPTNSIFDTYFNIMKSSLQQVSHGMILNVLIYSLSNSINVINEALIQLFYLDTWWYPCLALGISYLCIQLGLLMYDKLFNSKPNQASNQSIANILFNTSKIILSGMLGLYTCSLFDLITQTTGLTFWQYSLLISSFVFIATFVYDATKYFYNSMQEATNQYEPRAMFNI